MATINFNTAASSGVSTAKAHAVYTRATWAASWTARPDIAAIQCVWNAAPNTSSATLVRDYGRVFLPGSTGFSDTTQLAIEGSFVLIEWSNDEGGVNYWLGVIESSSDDADGSTDGNVPASGRQSFACFGMERLLQRAPVFDTVRNDAGTAVRSGGAATFNHRGQPNRSAAKVDGAYLFEYDADHYWSTRDIVEHLLTYHLPTVTGEPGAASIPWALANSSIVPDWDAPEVDPEGLTVYSLLNRLLDSRRLLGWAAGFDNTSLTVAPFSLAISAVTLADKTFAANVNQHAVLYGSDPLTKADIVNDRSDMADQVIVRGARRLSVATLRANNELDETWTNNQRLDYNDGASSDAGYSGLDQLDKRAANESARRSNELADVFSRLKIADDWDFTTEDGVDVVNVFPPESGTDPYKPFLSSVQILESLPFRSGFDYSGDISALTVRSDKKGRPPTVSLEIPGTSDRIDVAEIGEAFKTLPANGETLDYTFTTFVDPEDSSIRLRVNGAPQHVIGGVDFVPLAIDQGYTGDWSWIDVHATLAIREDRYCEYVYPSTPPSVDVVRRMVFHVGDEYRQIYIVPGTVVQVRNFEELTSDGGYLEDDTDKLEYLAKLLYAYHSAPRKSLTIKTQRRTGIANIGDMIATANGAAIGAVVTRIQIDTPLGDGGRQRDPSQEIVSTSIPLDYLAALSVASKDT